MLRTQLDASSATRVCVRLTEGLGAKSFSQKRDSIAEQTVREVSALAIFVSASLHNLLFIVETEAKHLVFLPTHGETR